MRHSVPIVPCKEGARGGGAALESLLVISNAPRHNPGGWHCISTSTECRMSPDGEKARHTPSPEKTTALPHELQFTQVVRASNRQEKNEKKGQAKNIAVRIFCGESKDCDQPVSTCCLKARCTRGQQAQMHSEPAWMVCTWSSWLSQQRTTSGTPPSPALTTSGTPPSPALHPRCQRKGHVFVGIWSPGLPRQRKSHSFRRLPIRLIRRHNFAIRPHLYTKLVWNKRKCVVKYCVTKSLGTFFSML